ncbi:hypothetical protein INR49_011360, partial [Caranx melampygus]
MSAATNTFENVKNVILSAHKNTASQRDKVNFYSSWAENYEQDVAVLDYSAPSHAANIISSHFSGVDGSQAMLELAKDSGLYQDLKQSILGEETLPVQWADSFDVVVIVGALSVGQVPVAVIRELCKSTKPGGYICMTTRSNCDNLEYKGALEHELKQMEEEGLWSCVEVTEVEDWERAVSEQEEGYISGALLESGGGGAGVLVVVPPPISSAVSWEKLGVMGSSQKSFDTVKDVIAAVRSVTTVHDRMAFYDSWAESYDQDVALMDNKSATEAVKLISPHFSGDHEAVVLDVACGTGLVALQLKRNGFKHFVGIDGSKAMLEQARKKELYQDLKQCILGEEPLPVEKGSTFHVVVIIGALSVDHVPVCVLRELCSACKPGGYVCMASRHGHDNMEFIASLERESKQMEEEGLWSCVVANVVEDWARNVSEPEGCYVPGSIYLYKRLYEGKTAGRGILKHRNPHVDYSERM